MEKKKSALLSITAALSLLFAGASVITFSEAKVTTESFIRFGEEWMYYGLDEMPDSSWYMSFDDNPNWKRGFTYFTAGEASGRTKLPMYDFPYSTYYFRKYMYLADASEIINMTFKIDYDDSYILFINGREIKSSDPGVDWHDHGSYSQRQHDSLLDRSTSNQGYATIHLRRSDLDHFRNGKNLLAVAIKQKSPISSDAAFTLSACGWVRTYKQKSLIDIVMSYDKATILASSILFSALVVIFSIAYVHIRLKQR